MNNITPEYIASQYKKQQEYHIQNKIEQDNKRCEDLNQFINKSIIKILNSDLPIRESKTGFDISKKCIYKISKNYQGPNFNFQIPKSSYNDHTSVELKELNGEVKIDISFDCSKNYF